MTGEIKTVWSMEDEKMTRMELGKLFMYKFLTSKCESEDFYKVIYKDNLFNPFGKYKPSLEEEKQAIDEIERMVKKEEAIEELLEKAEGIYGYNADYDLGKLFITRCRMLDCSEGGYLLTQNNKLYSIDIGEEIKMKLLNIDDYCFVSNQDDGTEYILLDKYVDMDTIKYFEAEDFDRINMTPMNEFNDM